LPSNSYSTVHKYQNRPIAFEAILSQINTKKGAAIIAAGLFYLLLIPATVSNSVIQPAKAQTASSTSAVTTFHAKGVVGNLVLPLSSSSTIAPPQDIIGNVLGGTWSLDVVNGNVQNLTLNLMTVDLSGKNFQMRTLSGLTNVHQVGSNTTIGSSNATATSTLATTGNITGANTTASSSPANMTAISSASSNSTATQQVVLNGNNTLFQGTVNGVGQNGTNQSLSITFQIINGNLANIWLQSTTNPLAESSRLPIFGITTSLTDANGNSLLQGRGA
jgi:hypothetical protein